MYYLRVGGLEEPMAIEVPIWALKNNIWNVSKILMAKPFRYLLFRGDDHDKYIV